MTDISTIAFSTPRAKDERRGGGKVTEGGKPVDKGGCDFGDFDGPADFDHFHDDMQLL